MVIESHKKSLLCFLTLTYVLMGNSLSLFKSELEIHILKNSFVKNRGWYEYHAFPYIRAKTHKFKKSKFLRIFFP